MNKDKKQKIKVPCELKNELHKFCIHLNTYKGMEDIRFDFMLIDYLNGNKPKCK